MSKKQEKQKYYTLQDVADILRVSRDTIRRYIKDGKLEAIKLTEKNYRISQKELDRFVSKRCRK